MIRTYLKAYQRQQEQILKYIFLCFGYLIAVEVCIFLCPYIWADVVLIMSIPIMLAVCFRFRQMYYQLEKMIDVELERQHLDHKFLDY